MLGNRPSSLPIAQFCAKSPALNLGAGRAAAMSSVWHARAAGKPWEDAYRRLTEEEQDEINAWKLPTDIVLENGAALIYAEAHKETECGLKRNFGFALKDHPECVTGGHCDFHWVINRVLYVADLKKSEWTTSDGPRSLQLLCYALALAAKYGDDIDGFVCGIWAATEGTWTWGEYIDLCSDECLDAGQRVMAAALNVDGEFATGPHCRGCYARSRCPAYLVPPDQAHGALATYLTGTMTGTQALELKRTLEAVETTVEACKGALKAYVDEHGPIMDLEAGKMYAKGPVKGKLALDKKALEAEHPDLVQQYTRQLPDHTQYSWKNIPKEKK